MKNFCNFCPKLLMAFFALLLSIGNMQAQSQANCDLSKCSPEKKAECAKKCVSNASYSIASLTSFLFADEKKLNCKPAACKTANTAAVKLVATYTKTTPDYSNSLEVVVEEKPSKSEKKNSCAPKCHKVKTSL